MQPQDLTQLGSYGSVGDYAIIKTIGSGGTCKVKLGIHKQSGTNVAVKIFNQDIDHLSAQLMREEVQRMRMLDHKYICRVIDSGYGEYKKQNGDTRNVNYVVTELLEGGSLFDFIALPGAFSERVARYYTQQIFEALKYTHSQGICHRDMKLENTMLDSNYDLKIIDFGFSVNISKNADQLLYTKLGTEGYMAPEIIYDIPYSGAQVDLWATAVMMFTMISQGPPMADAKKRNPHFKCLVNKKYEMFWKAHMQGKPDNFYSIEFKNLMEGMLQLQQKHRPTLEEIQNHSWYNGPVPSKQEIINEFNQRQQIVQQQFAQQAAQDGPNQHSGGVFLGGKSDLTQLEKGIDTIEFFQKNGTYFMTTDSPDQIQKDVITYLGQEEIEPLVNSENKYKMQFEFECQEEDVEGADQIKDVGEEEENKTRKISMTMKIYKVKGQDKYCVEFLKSSGLQWDFYKYYNILKNEILGQYHLKSQ